jgi:hypothetical protein
MTSIKQLTGKIALEIPAVILAVFMALAVNNCNEERKAAAAAQRALDAILLEIQNNKASLSENLEDNRLTEIKMLAIKDSIELAGEEEWTFEVEIGYEQTFLSTAAWEMAQLTGATQQLGPALVQDLSLLYDLQKMYIRQGDRFFEHMSSVDFHLAREQPEAQVDATLTLIKITESIGQAAVKKYDAFIENYGP